MKKRQFNKIFEVIFGCLTSKGWKFIANSGEYFYIYTSPSIELEKGISYIFKTSRKTLKNGHVFKNFSITKK